MNHNVNELQDTKNYEELTNCENKSYPVPNSYLDKGQFVKVLVKVEIVQDLHYYDSYCTQNGQSDQGATSSPNFSLDFGRHSLPLIIFLYKGLYGVEEIHESYNLQYVQSSKEVHVNVEYQCLLRFTFGFAYEDI